MNDYQNVNKEIQNFLLKRSPSLKETPAPTMSSDRELLPILKKLCEIYRDINECLRSGNVEGLKDVILKSDVKMNLVCESLLETLRMTIEERDKLRDDNMGLEEVRRESEEKIAKQRMEISKLEEENKIKKDNLNELNRIIKDQKDRVCEIRNENEQVRNEIKHERMKNEELLNLKSKAYERIKIYEKEMEGLQKMYVEREDGIKRLVREKKEEEDKNSGIKKKIVEYEKGNEILENKLRMKERNLMLCNSELSKVLEENRGLKEENEKNREGCEYYERLYKSVNKQNEYLNEQMRRMLEVEEYNKDGAAVINKYIGKIKKQKRKIKRLERKKRKMKEELEERNKNETFLSCSTFESRIEELAEENKKYAEKLIRLENEKKEIEKKIEFLEKNKLNEKEKKVDNNNENKTYKRNFNGYEDYYKFNGYKEENKKDRNYKRNFNGYEEENKKDIIRKEDNNSEFKINNKKSYNSIRNDYNIRTSYNDYKIRNDNVFTKFDEMFSSPSYTASVMPELRKNNEPKGIQYAKPNLYNNYEEDKILVGGFHEEEYCPQPKKDIASKIINEPGNERPIYFGINEPKNERPIERPIYFGINEPENERPIYFGTKTKKEPENDLVDKANKLSISNLNKTEEEEASMESIKTYHTTSTLKDMIARTDKLQKKFENLEEQLANIKEDNSEKNLESKIKAYNSHLSELNIDSNDSDFF